jgi:hypothetical protein
MASDPEVALIALAGVVVSAAIALVSARQSTLLASKNARAIEELKIRDRDARDASKFIEPLARAAYELESRLYNILRQALFEAYFARGTDREKQYTVSYTLYLIGAYFCWSETLRLSLRFTNVVNDNELRDVLVAQERISRRWASDGYPRTMRIFAGEQRAIGELFSSSLGETPTCAGYLEFLQGGQIADNPLIEALREDLLSLAGGTAEAKARLVDIQHALIDLLEIVDPRYVRFPKEQREKA